MTKEELETLIKQLEAGRAEALAQLHRHDGALELARMMLNKFDAPQPAKEE